VILPNVALAYDPDGYVESTRPKPGGAAGLMGRQVAGQAFLNAYLSHGHWETLAAVVRARAEAEPLVEFCKRHPSSIPKRRRLKIIEEAAFLLGSNPDESIRVLHAPCPPSARYAWARHSRSAKPFAISGITHTLSTPTAMAALGDLVVAPFESYDALICTSRAVVQTVRAVADAMADYLRERFGGEPKLKARLELIPLGVDVERFRPATAKERENSRQRFRITNDEVAVLCVGRLSHHAKAHPYPVFHAVEEAARRTGKRVHLAFAGWASNRAVMSQYQASAKLFAPSVRVSFLNGQDAQVRATVWAAADLFVSLPDNVQETFGLVVTEAMASGLPVVASDWNGYRDLIVDGETGFLVPTQLVRNANVGSTSRLLFGGVNYDHFLAECSQATVVDLAAAAEAMTRLVADEPLRRQLGAAGRNRAVVEFSWQSVIGKYERLWKEQAEELDRHRGIVPKGPVVYPPVEQSFAAYPTTWLDDHSRVWTGLEAVRRLPAFLKLPLTNLEAQRRCSDSEVLASLLNSAVDSRTVGEISNALVQRGIAPETAAATVAWLLKYGLLVTSAGE